MSQNSSPTGRAAISADRLEAGLEFEDIAHPRHAEQQPVPLLPARKYKTIPEDWKALPEGRYVQVISHLEAVLLDISADGNVAGSSLNDNPSPLTLRRWADHLRMALKQLTK
jgi:hypothetical protein